MGVETFNTLARRNDLSAFLRRGSGSQEVTRLCSQIESLCENTTRTPIPARNGTFRERGKHLTGTEPTANLPTPVPTDRGSRSTNNGPKLAFLRTTKLGALTSWSY